MLQVDNWSKSGGWGATTDSYNGDYAYSESPSGNYSNNEKAYLTSPSFDFSNSSNITLSFYHKLYVESSCDYAYVQISTDNGNNWVTIETYSSDFNWKQESIDLSSYKGYSNVKIRFYFYSDNRATEDGWTIDNIRIIK